jgi:transposase
MARSPPSGWADASRRGWRVTPNGCALVAAEPELTIAAPRHDGRTASCIFDGAIDGARLPASVEGTLAPTLRPGDVVVMDDLAAHKVAGIRGAVDVNGAEFAHLPAHGRDPDPIEQVFAKLTTLVRRAGARTGDEPATPSAALSTP